MDVAYIVIAALYLMGVAGYKGYRDKTDVAVGDYRPSKPDRFGEYALLVVGSAIWPMTLLAIIGYVFTPIVIANILEEKEV